MAMIVENKPDVIDNTRRFDSIVDQLTINTWEFKYITQDINGNDQTRTGEPVDENKENYPVGTIFFDSEPVSVYLTTSIKNIYLDNTPPVFKSENIQYIVFGSDYTCSFVFESDTPLDIAQLVISCGDDILFKSTRKGESVDSGNINNITLVKNNNNYTLKFKLDSSYDVEKLNADQITVNVWDIASNTAEYTTAGTWIYFEKDIDSTYIQPLIIEIVEILPTDKIIRSGIEGELLVKVTNPNIFLRDIIPTIQLGDGSIGFLDRSTFTYYPNTDTNSASVLLFKITNIKDNGNVIIDAWINIDNTEIAQKMKDETFAEAIVGPFIMTEEGREYKFRPSLPKYMSDDHYGDFIMFCQDMLNTSQYSLSTGNRISTLEKIARINDFNDINRIEIPYLEFNREQFNFEITPNFSEYLYFMDNRLTSGSVIDDV